MEIGFCGTWVELMENDTSPFRDVGSKESNNPLAEEVATPDVSKINDLTELARMLKE